jgi:hypothetical protein
VALGIATCHITPGGIGGGATYVCALAGTIEQTYSNALMWRRNLSKNCITPRVITALQQKNGQFGL